MRVSHRTGGQRSYLAGVLVIVVVLGLRPVAAQTCVGDCDGDGAVNINELITGVNIALGKQDVSTCPAFADANNMVAIEQLIQAVNAALDGCPATPTPTAAPTVTLNGSCAQPGSGPNRFRPCDTGTLITAFRCNDRTQCLHQQGLVALATTTVASDGTWSVEIPLSDTGTGAALVFEASITEALVYRVLDFGPVGPSHRTGLARGVASTPIAITPVSEAAVQLLDSNGFENYSDTGAQEVLSAVDQATADISFAGVAPDMAVALALQTASADPTVMMVLQSARNTPTPTDTSIRVVTSTPTPTPSDTRTTTSTATSTPTDTFTSVATSTATATPTPSDTATSTPTPTATPTATPAFPPTPPVISNGSFNLIAVNDAGFCGVQDPDGSHFTLEFDFTDLNGDVVKPPAAVKTQGVFLPSMFSGPEIDLPFFSITGTGASGHVSASICTVYAGNTSVNQNVVLLDAQGGRSNTLVINVPRPSGAN